MMDFLENETAMVSAFVTAATALFTGPLFQMDPAAVGSITAFVVVVFNFWVRYSVYSKKGVAKVATAVAMQAVEVLSSDSVGPAGVVTPLGQDVIQTAVEDVMGSEALKPPGGN